MFCSSFFSKCNLLAAPFVRKFEISILKNRFYGQSWFAGQIRPITKVRHFLTCIQKKMNTGEQAAQTTDFFFRQVRLINIRLQVGYPFMGYASPPSPTDLSESQFTTKFFV